MYMCKGMLGRHVKGALGEAAWTVKCCFSGRKVADVGCAAVFCVYGICVYVFYLLIGGFFYVDFVKQKLLLNFEHL